MAPEKIKQEKRDGISTDGRKFKMKLAEALQERADLNRSIMDLRKPGQATEWMP